MNNRKKNKSITRVDFLKSSGLLAAGVTFFPSFVSAALRDEKWNQRGTFVRIADYQIVIPEQADPIVKQAAKQFSYYLSEMSNYTVSVVSEREFQGEKAFYLGSTNFAKAQNIHVDELAEDGYVYQPVGNQFIIAGGTKKGVLYGVYDLLEGLGCKRYSPDHTHIPQVDSIAFPDQGRKRVPPVVYRTTSYSAMGKQEYADWHKISSRGDWGLFVHTFNLLVSPTVYGKTHPEYFSLINGVRIPGTQLCLSNQAVVDLVVSNLRKEIEENPEPKYWSVSQNDNAEHCQCVGCTALDKKYGDVPSGSMIYFVNQVAQQFPEKVISTLAYWYTRKAPKNILPEPNVNIMLCNIESKRQKPVFETDPAFSEDLRNWGKVSKDILIWDYNVQFTNYFSPFPNLYTLKPNIQFYRDSQVNALFMQACGEAGAEMATLRSYLISKLMWDPHADADAIIDDFVMGYYGAAGPYIRQYIDLLHLSLERSGAVLDIFGSPTDAKDTFLTEKLMTQYKELFDKAEAAVRSDQVFLERVEIARLPILFAEVQISRTEIDTSRSLFHHVEGGFIGGRPAIKALVNTFVSICNREGFTQVRERSGTPKQYGESYSRIFSKLEDMKKAKSYLKKIISITNPSPTSKGVAGLTDGLFGSYEAWRDGDQHFIAYEGVHMDFILDLGEVVPIQSIAMDFLNPQSQPDWHLMALPKHVTYSISVDNESYGDPIQIDNPHHPNPLENPEISSVSMYSFATEMNEYSPARYIKVHAENLLTAPAWHIHAGKPFSILSDQIVVL